jgi:16S rRNA (cytosine1402-N4)-methyltransferase
MAGARMAMVHVPVLLAEVGQAFRGVDVMGTVWGIDGTLGAAGHASRTLDSREDFCLLGTDQDDQMLAIASARLSAYGDRVALRRARISELDALLEAGDHPFEGRPAWMLFDLGVASLHLDEGPRGFSFGADAELDMRMDRRRELTAADIVNTWSEADLADLFFNEGDERKSRAVAAAILAARRRTPIRRTLFLADLVEGIVGSHGKTHGATRVFQALRREVNREGAELKAALELGAKWLAPGGVLAIIGFHSGENRVVKHWMADVARSGRFELLFKKPLRATHGEVRQNPRARSAELRAVRRLGGVA